MSIIKKVHRTQTYERDVTEWILICLTQVSLHENIPYLYNLENKI